MIARGVKSPDLISCNNLIRSATKKVENNIDSIFLPV